MCLNHGHDTQLSAQFLSLFVEKVYEGEGSDFIMTKLSVLPFASATAEMCRQGSPVKGRTLLFLYSTLFCLLYFLIGLSFTLFLFAFFRPLSQSRRILFYITEGPLPPSLPILLLLLCHSFCITFQFLQAFSGHLKPWLTGSVCHVKSLFIIYSRKRTLRIATEQKNAVTCLHLAKSKVRLDRPW